MHALTGRFVTSIAMPCEEDTQAAVVNCIVREVMAIRADVQSDHGPASGDLSGLRVLMLTASYLPRSGGVERHVRFVVRELVRRGIAVRIATPRWEDAWPEQEMIDGIEVTRLDLDAGRGSRALRPLVDWAEVVHTHDAYPFLKYYLLHRLRNRRLPVFATFHGYEAYPIPLEAKVLRRIVVSLTRGSICAGAFIPKWYRVGCSHITHGGVDAPSERPAIGGNAVFVGRLEPDSGFLDYLEALRLLKEQHGLDLPLEVCGDGSLRARGEETVAASGLDVVFHGRVPDVMPYLMQARFAFVSGFLGILEAMALGQAVFAVYDNPLKEDYLRLFPGAEHIAICATPEAVAVELMRLMQSPEALDQRITAAHDFAKTQTWGSVAEMYLSLYDTVPRSGGV